MNMPRMLILAVAAIAAGAAALLARSLLGGGTPAAVARPAPMIATSDVLVAASAIQPGQKLNPMLVRWQRWPTSNIDSSFITHRQQPNIALAVNNTVARAPLMAGEPLSNSKIVHTDSVGFMAATLGVGMRAVSIPITTESGAGGFILPNDRVDLMLSVQISDNPKRYQAQIVLANVRVLAVDQTIKQDQNQKVVLAKTATLELTPAQARAVVRAQSTGMLSLALRPLGEGSVAVASAQPPVTSPTAASPSADDDGTPGDSITVIRFGVEGSVNGKKD
jgi:pilus assembly protein CpaB